MTPDPRLRAWVDLAASDGLGSRDLHQLLTALGSPEAVLAASYATLSKIVSATVAQSIKNGAAPSFTESVFAWLAEPGNQLLTWDDPDYPKALLDVGDAPALIYFKGRRELLNRPALAVVGSRNATAAGSRTAEELGEALAAAGLTIVSGMAQGIDSAAHRGALKSGRQAASTLAIVGTGIDRIYPRSNRDLA